jgi:hypothetical protein
VREGPKRRVAQEALVCHLIPRALRRPCRRRGRQLVPTQGPSEQSGGIRDVIIRVSADDEAIELFACHARGASARLEVECEGGGGDKGSGTAAAGTAQVGGLVDPGIQVVTEVALALEKTVAISAIMVPGTLSVVLLTRIGTSEVTAAIMARPVDTGIPYVLLQGMVARERYRAAIAIRHWHGMVVVRCEEGVKRSKLDL